ncbi:MAG: hypothetical protein JWN09_1309 [Microbacteriaceae bacterium]|jgi:hypothetical protein|nr:hypothetical protein [Microbacteriaceae bacterium]
MDHTSSGHDRSAAARAHLRRWDASAHRWHQTQWRRQPPSPAEVALLTTVVIWGLAWKAVSLWRAAGDNSKPWFAVLFVSNTAGILDALYIFVVSANRRRSARDQGELHRSRRG